MVINTYNTGTKYKKEKIINLKNYLYNTSDLSYVYLITINFIFKLILINHFDTTHNHLSQNKLRNHFIL